MLNARDRNVADQNIFVSGPGFRCLRAELLGLGALLLIHHATERQEVETGCREPEREGDQFRPARTNDMGYCAGIRVQGQRHAKPLWRIVFGLAVGVELGQTDVERRRLILPVDLRILAAAIGQLHNHSDNITVAIETALNGRLDVDRDDRLLFQPKLNIFDLRFGIPHRNTSDLAIAEKAQHLKSPSCGAEDNDDFKSKLDQVDPCVGGQMPRPNLYRIEQRDLMNKGKVWIAPVSF